MMLGVRSGIFSGCGTASRVNFAIYGGARGMVFPLTYLSVRVSEEQRLPSFWQVQAGGWTVYFVLQLLSFLPAKELRSELVYRLAFCAICFLASFPQHVVCRRLWRKQA